MATRPSLFPTWATTGSVVEPGAAKKALGWQAGEKPKASYQNWLHNTTEDWLEYLDQEISTAQAERVKQQVREQIFLVGHPFTTGHTLLSACSDIIYVSSLGLYIACGEDYVASSPDGVVWTTRSTAVGSWSRIAWNGSIFCIIDDQAAVFYTLTSADGITWALHGSTSGEPAHLVWASALSLFVAVGSDGGGSLSEAYTSPDGITWTARAMAAGSWHGVTWNPTSALLVAVGNSGLCATSPDGITWTTRTISVHNWQYVYWWSDVGLYVAISDGGAVAATSPDGITWTDRTIPVSNYRTLVQLPNLLLAVGMTSGDGFISVTQDGITWLRVAPVEAYSAAWGGNKLVYATGAYTSEIPAF